jgi:hypothetical protein
MARARLLKPGFFTNAKLSTLSPHARLLFAGLWTLADREGRMKDEPLWMRGQLFPYEEVAVDVLLKDLARAGFIKRYRVGQLRLIEIVSFLKHQQPHYMEPLSVLPSPTGEVGSSYVAVPVRRAQRVRILARDGHRCAECDATEKLSIDHIVPRSLGGDSSDKNLRVLCKSCNSKKRNRLQADAVASSVSRQSDFNAPSINTSTPKAEAEAKTKAKAEVVSIMALPRHNICVLYDDYMGKPSITAMLKPQLLEAEDTYPPECITHCFEIAAASSDGRRSWNYVRSILERHAMEGCNERPKSSQREGMARVEGIAAPAGVGFAQREYVD